MALQTSDILKQFARTTEEIFSLSELERILNSGRQLRIKYGVDLTAPYLHIGHAVNLWMMRMLQDLGHKVQFLIGDTTTRIGDPSREKCLASCYSTGRDRVQCAGFYDASSNGAAV